MSSRKFLQLLQARKTAARKRFAEFKQGPEFRVSLFCTIQGGSKKVHQFSNCCISVENRATTTKKEKKKNQMKS